jgi:hypothetical protein
MAYSSASIVAHHAGKGTALVSHTGRTKIVEVAGGDPAVLRQLLAEPGR